jgi:hypothetical protein
LTASAVHIGRHHLAVHPALETTEAAEAAAG